jgi:putative glycosyltransferase (TIGR04372 family)
MILKNIDINRYLKLLLSPLPPVDYDRVIFRKRFTLIERLIFTIKKNNINFLNLFILFKHCIISIVKILYTPIIILFYIFNFRILHINYEQIGAFVHQLDFVIKNNKLNEKYKLITLAPNFLRVNNFIFDLYKKELFFYTSNFFIYLFFYPLIHCRLTSLEPWSGEVTNPLSEYNKIHSNYNKVFKDYKCDLNFISNLEYKNFLKKMKIEGKKIVSIHIKDSFFYNYKSNRSSDINTYKKTILYLLRKNLVVIRFTHLNSSKLNINNNKYIEFEINTELDKKLQFLIIKNSYYFICNQSGPMNYDSLVDTPFLLTNALPINICGLIKKKDRFIFKKFYNYQKKYFLNILEIYKNNFHLYPELCQKENISIIDNNENDILLAAKEMNLNIKKNFFNPDYRQLNFFSLVKKNYSIKFTDAVISKRFYC